LRESVFKAARTQKGSRPGFFGNRGAALPYRLALTESYAGRLRRRSYRRLRNKEVPATLRPGGPR